MNDGTTPPRGTIEIDPGLCSGLGECVRVAPDIVAIDTDGLAHVRTAAGDLRLLQQIAGSCPMAAIVVSRLDSDRAA